MLRINVGLVRVLLLFMLQVCTPDYFPVVGAIPTTGKREVIGKPVDKTEEGEERPERSVDKLDEIFLSLGKMFSDCQMFDSISIYS